MNKEILLVAEAVSNEKGVDSGVIFEAIEAALEMATKKRAGSDIDVKVTINRKTGDYQTVRRWLVVADEEEGSGEDEESFNVLTLTEAMLKNPKIQAGEYFEEAMESIEFGRIAA